MKIHAVLGFTLLGNLALQAAQPIRLQVDAREASRRLLHATLTVPAAPGPLTLVYPKWIPGEHGPTGPITDLVALRITAGGQPLAWRRDDVDMMAFQVVVPVGASEVQATYDFLLPSEAQGFSAGASSTDRLAMLSWNQVLLYPKGAQSDAVTFQASLQLPAGWRYATALALEAKDGGGLHFKPVTLTNLVDSPLLAGRYLRTVDLTQKDPIPHRVTFAADSEEALALDARTEAGFKALVRESGALFGSRHYAHYDFLVSLSDHVAHFGLEHHQSSDDRLSERSLLDPNLRLMGAGLLPHEMVHSWNGKYRRPAGLATGNFHDPMKGELLWVYEGLTQYLGNLLTARSGLYTPEEYRDALAVTAAEMDAQEGRAWRPLVDTAVAAQLLYGASQAWSTHRRSVDYYPEGDLLWLEVDATLRQATGNKKSLDDFCKRFHGGPGGAVELRPYSLKDVVEALNAVAPRDWERFFQERVMAVAPRAPLGGLEKGGWRLVFAEEPTPFQSAAEAVDKGVNLRFSLGLLLKADGNVQDVVPDLAADKAGLAPGMKLLGVNGRTFSPDVLKDALKAKGALELLVENRGYYRTCTVAYQGGLRYPRLERVPGSADLLADIIAAKTKP